MTKPKLKIALKDLGRGLRSGGSESVLAPYRFVEFVSQKLLVHRLVAVLRSLEHRRSDAGESSRDDHKTGRSDLFQRRNLEFLDL